MDIPDSVIPFDIGVGKGEISFSDFNIESFTFFQDDEMIVDFIVPDSIELELFDAGLVMSVDYALKLTTFPYSSMAGSAVITLEGFDISAAIEAVVTSDTTDQSCGLDACGYLVDLAFTYLKVNIDKFHISYVGDVNPILELLTDILEDAMIPMFTEFLSSYAADLINGFLRPVNGDTYTYDPYPTFLELAIGGPISFSDLYGDMPFFFAHTMNDENDNPLTYIDPILLEYDPFWFPSFPDIYAGTDMAVFVSPGFVHAALYQQFTSNRATWEELNQFTATRTRIGCITEKDGCGTSGEYEADSALSFMFETDTYADLGIDELLACPGCNLEVSWGLSSPDLDPVIPEFMSIALDGFYLDYNDVYVTVRGVIPDSYSDKNDQYSQQQYSSRADTDPIAFEVSFIVSMTFKAILLSDHAYINTIQNFYSLNSISPVSSSLSVLPSDDITDDQITQWSALLKIITSIYLGDAFSNIFEHQFGYTVNIPIGFMFSCTWKEEEAYYNPDENWMAMSFQFDMCGCDCSQFKYQSRDPTTGMVYCVEDIVV
ncbi:hypothetical protein ADUPG1_007843 [Aduncisulcus paluster]|uniref:Lipid-binding serum glycoprotein C-terminal domain-containing protein n=1 Tax=Aduncisulcus paluster TaxID=2918883 RepID=A0ABQ5KSA7_9EUKA|nr:hypothetical protein ADUPG1_007843 [Aduncisulcus paluster]